MAEPNLFSLSGLNQLSTGVGWYSFSGLIAASTGVKPVILINNTGQRDSMITVTFGGAVNLADLTTGNDSVVALLLGGLTVYQNKVQTIPATGPWANTEFSLFIPRNSTLLINVTDTTTVGKHTTMVRAYYV
jgi:hypothetical protein